MCSIGGWGYQVHVGGRGGVESVGVRLGRIQKVIRSTGGCSLAGSERLGGLWDWRGGRIGDASWSAGGLVWSQREGVGGIREVNRSTGRGCPSGDEGCQNAKNSLGRLEKTQP